MFAADTSTASAVLSSHCMQQTLLLHQLCWGHTVHSRHSTASVLLRSHCMAYAADTVLYCCFLPNVFCPLMRLRVSSWAGVALSVIWWGSGSAIPRDGHVRLFSLSWTTHFVCYFDRKKLHFVRSQTYRSFFIYFIFKHWSEKIVHSLKNYNFQKFCSKNFFVQ